MSEHVPPTPPSEAEPPQPPPPVETPSRNAADVGQGISAAAANPGTSAALNNQVREARQTFAGTTFEGSANFRDAINGDVFNVYQGERQTTALGAVNMADEVLVECRETFVPPDGVPLREWAGRWLVIVRGSAGYGKAALALALVAESGAPSKVFGLNPETRLDKLTSADLEQSAAYVLTDLSSSSAATLTAFDLERLAADAERLRSRIVVTVRPETTFTDGGIARYVVDLPVRAEPRRVLDKHLRRRLRTRPDLVDLLLGRDDVGRLVDRELPPGASLAKAAELARLIADHADQPERVADRVGDRLTYVNEQEFVSWFGGLDELHLQCFAIALSIFNGLPYETVADTGLQLHRKFDVAGATAVATKAVPEAASPFGDGRAGRLHKLKAEVERTEVPTAYGTVTAEVVRYTDSSFPVRVLRHVWEEHDRARGGLLAWLRDLGGHPNQAVRIRAATAVGVFTAIAYDHMRHEVLTRWARSRDPERREAAAVALVGPAEDHGEALTRAVRNLVEEWGHGSAELRATAARAYGVNIGLVPLDTTLSTLEALSEDDDFDVIEAVCLSLTDLVSARGETTARRVLGLVRDWAGSRTEMRPVVAHLAFMFLAADLTVERPTPSGRVKWPALLWLGYCDQGLQRFLSELWAWSLNSADFFELSLTVLDEWAAMVEPDERARQVFAGLMGSACVHRRVAARLHQRASAWAKSDSSTSAHRTATELLSVLTQGGTHR